MVMPTLHQDAHIHLLKNLKLSKLLGAVIFVNLLIWEECDVDKAKGPKVLEFEGVNGFEMSPLSSFPCLIFVCLTKSSGFGPKMSEDNVGFHSRLLWYPTPLLHTLLMHPHKSEA
ncbi:hypothetical protein VNO77_03844 [Canavalia gladiata]|uniref:Uncharacterized protein n=1 Tax=Canavalia gladiata TaxID=3824 RepID=A0AAN9N0L3_CANGL